MRGRLNCSDKEGSERGKEGEGDWMELGTDAVGEGRKGRVSKRLVNCHDAQSLMEEGKVREVTVGFSSGRL